MQASKISLIVCVGALSLIPLLGRADDTPQEARLRAALRDAYAGKMTPAATPAPSPSTEAAAPAVVPMTNAPVAEAPATPPVAPTEAPATPAVAPVETPVTPAPVEAAPTTAAPVEATPAAPVEATAPAAPAMEGMAMTNAAPMAEQPAAAPVETVAPPAMEGMVMTNAPADMTGTNAMMTPDTARTNAEVEAMKQALKPVPVPVRELTADQKARLDVLTQKYKADQLSPEEYHTQRAKIIAEP